MQQRMRRRGFTIGLISLGLLATAALTASPAQAANKGPYYAEPAWDQKVEPATRFLVMTDWNSEAVLDRETGLVWENTPTTTLATPQSWLNARFTCANSAVGGRKGWRLPSLPELASLVDPSVASPGPTLSSGHPFLNVQSTNYWSASAHAENPALMWGVGFGNGAVLGLSKAFDQRAWCVRSGTNAE